METADPLDRKRGELDEIDDRILELLNRRIDRVLEIGRLKAASGLPVYDPEREKRILARLLAVNPGPLDAPAVARIFERVIDESRRIERGSTLVARRNDHPRA
ncbi:MAG: chorismate mutase [Planctomycetes bacterium]|nr:chorismate mutase [Planctomycetota bacterium]